MAGIYVHIPFCRQACHYCNFHFSTSSKDKNGLLAAILLEAEMRKSEIREEVTTIYLGGGTPSLLDAKQLNWLFESISDLFHVSADAEITLEANPDDLTAEYLQGLRSTPVNRLSIGIQSFRDEDLRWMNRAHDASQARNCIPEARKAGFEAISIDLIYGSPGLDEAAWTSNMNLAFDFQPDHLSCYALTVEPGTALAHFIKTGKSPAVDESSAALHFEMLMEQSEKAGFEHYEISNFCRNGKIARHNTAYWQGSPYLGLGPSAHSYIENCRSWNVSNNSTYVAAIHSEKLPLTSEKLSEADRFNEMLMTGLRTKWGINTKIVKNNFGEKRMNILEKEMTEFIGLNLLVKTENKITLSRKGKLIADRIISDLFWVDS